MFAVRTSSNMLFCEVRYYQFTAVDIVTRMTFIYLCREEK